MAKNELLPFANGEDANVLPTQQWEALTDILQNGFQSGIARSEQVNRVLAQGAVASYVLGQLIVDQLAQDATLDETTLYQNLILALQENAKDACLPLSGGNVAGSLTVQGKNVLRNINGVFADVNGYVDILSLFMPDYSSGVSKAWDTSHTAVSDGWLYYQCSVVGDRVQTGELWVDGVMVAYDYASWEDTEVHSHLVPIAKGSIFKATNGNGMVQLTFYPCKGV